MKKQSIYTAILGIESNFRGTDLHKSLVNSGISSEVILGLDVKLMSETRVFSYANQVQAKFITGRTLTSGEISCSLGHLEMYERFLYSDKDIGIFFEDDAILDEEFEKFIEDFICPDRPLIVNLAGYLNVNLMPKPFPVAVTREDFGFESKIELLLCLRYPVCAYGYLMNRPAAEIAVEAMRGKKINSPADFPFAWRNSIPFYLTLRSVVSHGENHSILDLERKKLDIPKHSNNITQHRIATLKRLSPMHILRGRRLGLSGRALFREIYAYYLLSKFFPKK